ncbi:MAG: hypothetical protein ACR2JC_04665 [Chloroflexota bacterium]
MRLEGSVSATSFGSEIRACLVIVPWMIGFLYLWLGFVLLWMAVFSVLAVAAATGGGGDWGVFLAFLFAGAVGVAEVPVLMPFAASIVPRNEQALVALLDGALDDILLDQADSAAVRDHPAV